MKAQIEYYSDYSEFKNNEPPLTSVDTGYVTAKAIDTYILTGEYSNPEMLSTNSQELKDLNSGGRLDYLKTFTSIESGGKSECIGFLNDAIVLKKSDGNYTNKISEATAFDVRGTNLKNMQPSRYKGATDISLAFLNDVTSDVNKNLILCSCIYSCGPFAESFSGLSPLTSSTGTVADVLSLLIDTRFLVAVVCLLIVRPAFINNTLKTQEDFHQEHEYAYRELIKTLTKRNTQLQKKLHMLES